MVIAHILYAPPELDGLLAAALVGCVACIRPELATLSDDPAIGRDAEFVWFDNTDLLTGLVLCRGDEMAARLVPFLPIGRATRIPRDCLECSEETESPDIIPGSQPKRPPRARPSHH